MLGSERLERIKDWLDSPEATELSKAYASRYAGSADMPHPEFFQDYMQCLTRRVQRALESNEMLKRAENIDPTLPVLLATLKQIEGGGELAEMLDGYFQETERGRTVRPSIGKFQMIRA